MRPFRMLLALAALTSAAGAVHAQRLTLQAESREMYAGLPFILSLTAEGFDQEPTPAQPTLAIDGCTVVPLGVSPNTSSTVTIINGRRSESRSVTLVYRYQVTAPKAGRYTVAEVYLDQAGRTAKTGAASFEVTEVEATGDMRIRMNLPDRPVWLGETFEVSIDWLLRKDPADQQFVVPLFQHEEFVQIEPAPVGGRRTLTFSTGTRTLELPFDRDTERVGGVEYTRFRCTALATANRSGGLDLEPVQVAARLEAGAARDMFGFRRARRDLFKAEGERQRLSVRALPIKGRPLSFVNAIGTAFSIAVQASRTVVAVGEPIELEIAVRGDGRLEGLSLPPLDADGGLDPALFSIPDESPTGTIDEQGRLKTFKVTVRLKSAEARGIPPIALSYFDPAVAEYRTVNSQPIALQVAGSTMVGADDVVGARPADAGPIDAAAGAGADVAPQAALAGSLVGADLSLSAPDQTLRSPVTLGDVWPLVAALYAVSVLIFGVRVWLVRTSVARGRTSARRLQLHEAERALEAAERTSAREAAPRLIAALQALARASTGPDRELSPLVEQIEVAAFDPHAADHPLPAGLRASVRAAIARCDRGDASPPTGSGAAARATVCWLVLGAAGAAPPAVRATTSSADREARIEAGRALYQSALQEKERARRTRLFTEAEGAMRTLADEHGDRPGLMTDWGNAALGAQDVGRATLAYRRALRLDPGYERARKNLAWVRGRAPRWLPAPAELGAVDTLFFWHHSLSVAERHVLGALGFAAVLLLVAPWGLAAERVRTLRRLAFLPFVLWVAMTASVLVEPDAARDGVVVVDGYTLRAADSLGAPPALGRPLPAGAEVRVLESRDAWTRIALADGTRGWVKSAAVERVGP